MQCSYNIPEITLWQSDHVEIYLLAEDDAFLQIEICLINHRINFYLNIAQSEFLSLPGLPNSLPENRCS